MAKLFSGSEGKSIFSLLTDNVGTILLVVAAFLLGVLVTENRYLKAGAGQQATAPAPQQAAQQPSQQAAAPQVTMDQVKKLFTDGNNLKFGDEKRKALFVEISDPSCPFCHIAGGLDKELNTGRFQLQKDGGTYVAPVEEMRKLVDAGKASFVWIYSPGHGNGEMGTKALYCGYEKGKFWQVHDLLMSQAGYQILNGYDANQQPTKGPIVKNDKAKSGDLADFLKAAVDPGFMKSCLESGKYDGRIASDTQLSSSLGVQGTPGFFINTTNFAGAYSWTDMKSAADAALK